MACSLKSSAPTLSKYLKPSRRCLGEGAAGGLDRARKRSLQLVDSALGEIDVLPSSPYRDALVEVARLSVDRVA
jgi:hypothetical protein